MFSAIGKAFNLSSIDVRKIVIDHLKNHKDSFAHVIPEKYWNQYTATMSVSGCWGDEIALSAAKYALKVRTEILYVKRDASTSWIRTDSEEKIQERTVYLGYTDNFHCLLLISKENSTTRHTY